MSHLLPHRIHSELILWITNCILRTSECRELRLGCHFGHHPALLEPLRQCQSASIMPGVSLRSLFHSCAKEWERKRERQAGCIVRTRTLIYRHRPSHPLGDTDKQSWNSTQIAPLSYTASSWPSVNRQTLRFICNTHAHTIIRQIFHFSPSLSVSLTFMCYLFSLSHLLCLMSQLQDWGIAQKSSFLFMLDGDSLADFCKLP